MYTIPQKKMVSISILDILRKYTDEEHRLSQQEIRDILKREYSLEVDRRTIKTNLLDLSVMYDVEYNEVSKVFTNKDGEQEETSMCSGWYLMGHHIGGVTPAQIEKYISET